MTNEKKSALLRTIVFTLIAFVPVYIIYIFFIDDINKISPILSYAIMFFPLIANVLTRLITKEGFSISFLGANFSGNIKFYVMSILYPIVLTVLNVLLLYVMFMSDAKLLDGIKISEAVPILLTAVSTGVLMFLIAMGEEYGWRAYLTPKLEKLMPYPVAITVSGIIWGLWHAPAITKGMNYGKDYSGFPWLGIILMCVSCIFYGAFLTYLTKKTNSVYPAAICHACVDSVGPVVMALMLNDPIKLAEHEFEASVISLNGFTVVFGIVAIILTMKMLPKKGVTE